MEEIYIFYAAIFIASIISTIGGFGTGAMVVAAGTMFFGAHEVLGITTLIFISNNITKVILFRKFIDYKIARIFIIWSVPTAIIGALLTAYISPRFLQILIGIVIALYLFSRYLNLTKNLRVTNTIIKISSMIYGFITSLVGTGGVIKAAVFVEIGLVKETFLATFAITSFFVNLTKLTIFTSYQYLNMSNLHVALIAVACCIVAINIGKYILQNYVSEKFFEYMVSILLGISAIKLLLFA
ncbi:sulfite exporter TauE/SafE family protein [Candidatus Amoebophilus asiaticus]|nr:sulfite exporter TauE/SafE family protein [Candidatus Amoebophilus asiaticus]